MNWKLVSLTWQTTREKQIALDDISHNSIAVYLAVNPDEKEFKYAQPDEFRQEDPRCDYLLTSCDEAPPITRFIELKGNDLPRRTNRCCRTEWDHAFHQLVTTYDAYREDLELGEQFLFILSTSIEKKRVAATRYKKYKWYRTIRENLNHDVKILYREDKDSI